VKELMTFLRGIPPALLESKAQEFETFYRSARGRERQAGMVDATGPGTPGASASRKGGRALLEDAIRDDLRRHPPRS
jgi:hypothetical protein